MDSNASPLSWKKPLRYAVTSGTWQSSAWLTDATGQSALSAWIDHCNRMGVQILQLREKQLPAGDALQLSRAVIAQLGRLAPASRPLLLVNGRPDVAVAAGVDGVHLSSGAGELQPAEVRAIFAQAGRPAPTVSQSCHTPTAVERASKQGADLILFGPVFEKRVAGRLVTAGVGLRCLQEACAMAGSTPVLALGGVTALREEACLEAGAAGIAAIRLFAPPAAGRCRAEPQGE